MASRHHNISRARYRARVISRSRHRVLAATIVAGCALSLAVVAVSASGPAGVPSQAASTGANDQQSGVNVASSQAQASAVYPSALRPYYQQRLR